MNDNSLIPPYVSVTGRAQWAIILFIATIILALYGVISTYSQINLLNDIAAGRKIAMAQAQVNDSRQEIIAVIQIVIFVITGIFFLMWFYRAHKNLEALGSKKLKFTPIGTVVWFFVPIFCLFKPYQAAQEVWKASDPGVTKEGFWRSAPSSYLVLLWWLLFLLSIFMSKGVAIMVRNAGESVAGYINASWVLMISNAVDIIAAIAAIVVVSAITARQEEKHRKVLMLKAQEDKPQINEIMAVKRIRE